MTQDTDSFQDDVGAEDSSSANDVTIALEAEASSKGWLPKDKYPGDPSKWVDAGTFVDRGKKFVTNLMQEITYLKKKVEGFEGTKAEVRKFYEEAMAKKDTELNEAITELRRQRTQAIRDGEDDQALAIEDRIDLLKEEKVTLKNTKPVVAVEETATTPELDPVLEEWIEDGNSWFKEDAKLQAYAVTLGKELLSKGETLRGRKLLDKITGMMKEDFPRKFNPSPRVRDSGVEPGSPGAGKASGKTERDLPEEERQLMNQFVKEKWITKEDFLKSYFSR